MGQRVRMIRSGGVGDDVFRSAPGLARMAGVAGLSLFALASPEAWAGHGHGYGPHWHGGSVGVVIGVPPVWPYYGVGAWPRWLGGPYVAVPPAVVVETSPPVYVERGSVTTDDAGGGSGGEGWWHYCSKPEGYYPNVKKCPGGWEKVAPSPSD